MSGLKFWRQLAHFSPFARWQHPAILSGSKPLYPAIAVPSDSYRPVSAYDLSRRTDSQFRQKRWIARNLVHSEGNLYGVGKALKIIARIRIEPIAPSI